LLIDKKKGTIYIVSTPIGNLEDITLRALRTLREVDLIAAEDTRKTRKLLSHYQISKPLTSYHDHNKMRKAPELINKLAAGMDLALVSGAGTPGISDPAYYLVQIAIKNDILITPIPGPTALIAALCISGLPTDKFVFEGFLPVKPGKRLKRLEGLKDEERTIILYEAPHRLLKLLAEIQTILGEREVVIVKEVTKLYEKAYRGTASTILDKLRGEKIQGEFTLIIRSEHTREARRSSKKL
jgi:16S rRNA (cytidine1402-2'-O)-methyltransferase